MKRSLASPPSTWTRRMSPTVRNAPAAVCFSALWKASACHPRRTRRLEGHRPALLPELDIEPVDALIACCVIGTDGNGANVVLQHRLVVEHVAPLLPRWTVAEVVMQDAI